MQSDRIDELLVWPEEGGLRAVAIRNGAADDTLLAGDGADAPGAIHRARVGQTKPEINLGFLTLAGGTQAAVNLGRGAAKPGDLATVQLVEPPTGEKQARASLRITLPGALAVAVIAARGVTWSRQIAAQKREELAADLPKSPHGVGLIVRRWAQDARAAELHEEAQQLLARAQALLARADATDQPRCLAPADAAQLVLHEFAPFNPRAIVCADATLARRLRQAAGGATERFKERITAVREGEHVADQHDAGGQLAQAAETTIALDGGGRMHIEKTHALVAIDIDTAAARGREGLALTRRVALAELARQLRLRDLTGRIVIDQPAPPGQGGARERAKLFDRLNALFRRDRRVVRIAGFTPTGLLELVRSRGGDDAT
jgi:Rne/Rng family ribonuclease